MGVRELALEIKKWAKKNRMMGDYPESPDVDPDIVRNVFGKAGVPLATKILQNRGISYVAIDELADEIIIFTSKKLNAREQRILQDVGLWDANKRHVNVVFMHSEILKVGGPPEPPAGIAAYTERNGLYTCGSSVYIGSEKGAGTLGCLVKDADGVLYGLSNNHVTGGSNYAIPGMPIIAPGFLDVGAGVRDPETIGHHTKAFPFADGLPDIADSKANIDAALFKILDASKVTSFQRDFYDTPNSSLPLEVQMVVEKVGRTSARTKGTVIGELFDFEPVVYILDVIGGKKVIYFQSLFAVLGEFAPFSYPGDSGSLVTHVDKEGNRHAVGLVVAGNSEGISLVLSIDRIVQHFGVEFVSGHNI